MLCNVQWCELIWAPGLEESDDSKRRGLIFKRFTIINDQPCQPIFIIVPLEITRVGLSFLQEFEIRWLCINGFFNQECITAIIFICHKAHLSTSALWWHRRTFAWEKLGAWVRKVGQNVGSNTRERDWKEKDKMKEKVGKRCFLKGKND